MKNKQDFYAKIDQGKLDLYDKGEFALLLHRLDGKEVIVTIEKETNRRTKRQNNALHLFFSLLADELNEAGLDMRKVLKPGIDIEWSGLTVKDYLWRPIQIAQLKKRSTTKLTTKEIDEVYETLNRFLGERFSIHIPFPSIEELIYGGDNN